MNGQIMEFHWLVQKLEWITPKSFLLLFKTKKSYTGSKVDTFLIYLKEGFVRIMVKLKGPFFKEIYLRPYTSVHKLRRKYYKNFLE